MVRRPSAAKPAGWDPDAVLPVQAPVAFGVGIPIPERDGCVWHPCEIEDDVPVEGVYVVPRARTIPPPGL